MEEAEKDFVTVNGRRTFLQRRDDIFGVYNKPAYDPRSGLLVKTADDLSAFIEAFRAVENGSEDQVLLQAKSDGPRKNADARIGPMKLGEIYKQFETDPTR